MRKKSWKEIKSLEEREIKRAPRFKERSLYSIKKDPIAFVIKDTSNGKYLLDNPEGASYSTEYSDDAWWGNTIDDASVFMDFNDASYTLEDINADFGEKKNKYSSDMDRFCINAVYSEDIFVKDSPIMGYRESEVYMKKAWKDNNILRESKEEHKIYKYNRDCYFIDFKNALDFVIKDVTRGGASRYVYDHYSSSPGNGDIIIFFGPKKENGEWAHIESIEEISTLD